MAIVVAADDAAVVTTALEATGETVHCIGNIVGNASGCVVSGSVETWSAQQAWEASYGE
jgi:phosphoribosylformylglycinamidine cyclo-ligase